MDFRDLPVAEGAKCLDSHTPFAEVEDHTVSPEDRAFRDQFNNQQLAGKECITSFTTLFRTGV